MISVEQTPSTTPQAVRLLDASQALMRELYTPEQNNYLSHDALNQPDVRFFTARIGDKAYGCAALQIKPEYGELKSFYVDKAARGKGVGQALLRQIEDFARLENLKSMKLETGNELAAACRLYEANGYVRCDQFGDYQDNGSSVFMTKEL